ncbi:MAG: hypothetical protein M1482_11500 [Chloroflexi bacterium]|nr:hypothetical protein [Chloroflexota bacterium]
MRVSRIALAFVAGFVVLWATSISTVQACDPIDYGAPASALWCQVRYRTPPTPTPAPTATPIVVAASLASAAPSAALPHVDIGGDSPSTALEVDQNEHIIPPGGRVWYKIGKNGAHIIVWMRTYGVPGLGFDVYAPDQPIGAPTTKRAGGGTYSPKYPLDLNWAGGQFLQVGTWYALVKNDSDKTLSYLIDVTAQLHDYQCNAYWEDLPGGNPVYWNACHPE